MGDGLLSADDAIRLGVAEDTTVISNAVLEHLKKNPETTLKELNEAVVQQLAHAAINKDAIEKDVSKSLTVLLVMGRVVCDKDKISYSEPEECALLSIIKQAMESRVREKQERLDSIKKN